MENINKYEATKGSEMVLEYLVKTPPLSKEKPALLLLLHGVGSNEKDLFNLADQFKGNILVVSARAPFALSPGRYAWFQVDFSSGTPHINEEQAEKSRQIINLFVNQLMERYPIDSKQIYLGGFSQGGIMSYSVGLTYPNKFAGIFAFSSRLLTQIRPFIKDAKSLAHLRVFIAHGTQDQTLPVTYGREAKEYLSPMLPKLHYKEYLMAHQIIDEELSDFKAWLGEF